MRLRSRRRDLVIWSLSVSPADKYGDSRLLRPVRRRRVRRALRLSVLLTLIGAMRLARGVRYRWRPLLAGTVLAVIGFTLRGGALGIVLLPGLWLWIYAFLKPGGSDADRHRLTELERELSTYSTAAERCDFAATLDRYPDEVSRELRDMLTQQAMVGFTSRIPGAGSR
jgi:hypothetical protein